MAFTFFFHANHLSANSQIEPSARNMAPHDVKVTFPDHACDHQFREGSFKATVSWESPRMNRPIRAYVVHVLTPTGVDITIHVDVTMTRQELNFLQCWSAYVIRVEALYESGDSAFSDALFFTTGKQNSKVLPQDLRADNIGYSCINGASTGSVKLSWKPAEVDSFNITGYTVIVTPQEFQSKIFTLDKDAKSFQYNDASCEGTTFFSVHARALVTFGLFGATPSEIALPDAYAVFSPKSKGERIGENEPFTL
ncbi:hypothetical protein V5799_021756 [Amblyomma americanum]|uniref:Fibronectin type-III domain-containing protein n=1 Tax=Amblyomma americanum TaxID=6943 RepID=A0AAQ4FMH1_AMBAM